MSRFPSTEGGDRNLSHTWQGLAAYIMKPFGSTPPFASRHRCCSQPLAHTSLRPCVSGGKWQRACAEELSWSMSMMTIGLALGRFGMFWSPFVLLCFPVLNSHQLILGFETGKRMNFFRSACTSFDGGSGTYVIFHWREPVFNIEKHAKKST